MTLNLPLLYSVWAEEYRQTGPNKNTKPLASNKHLCLLYFFCTLCTDWFWGKVSLQNSLRWSSVRRRRITPATAATTGRDKNLTTMPIRKLCALPHRQVHLWQKHNRMRPLFSNGEPIVIETLGFYCLNMYVWIVSDRKHLRLFMDHCFWTACLEQKWWACSKSRIF